MTLTPLPTHPARDFRDTSNARCIHCCDCRCFQIVHAASPESALKAFVALGWRGVAGLHRCPSCCTAASHPSDAGRKGGG